MDEEYVCRVCESASNLEIIFKKENQRLLVMLRYVACVSIEADDMLPRCICAECAKQLQQSYIFKRQCRNTDQKWRKICNSQKTTYQLSTIKGGSTNGSISLVTTPIDLPSLDVDQIQTENNDHHFNDDAIVDQIENLSVNSERMLPPTETTPKETIGKQPKTSQRKPCLLVAIKRLNANKYLNSLASLKGSSGEVRVKDTYSCKEITRDETFAGKDTESRREHHKHDDNELAKNAEKAKLIETDGCSERESNNYICTHQTDDPDGKCEKCHEKNKTQNSKQTCSRKEAFLSCDICGETFTESFSLEQHRMLHSTPKLKCDICNKEFTRSSALKQHKLSHTKPHVYTKAAEMKNSPCSSKPFECDQCGRLFSRPWNLRQHRVIHHKPLKGAQSGDAFKLYATFRRHQRQHINAKAVKCDQCGKWFARNDSLRRHQLLHSNQRDIFKCCECDKAFCRAEELDEHKRWHSDPTAFDCKQCGKSYSRLADLKEHVRLHTNPDLFKCKLCGKAFKCRPTLKQHLALHRNPELFKCEQCGRVFQRNRDLRKHQLLHTNSDLYKCHECNKTFTRRSRFTEHQITHTNPEKFECKTCGNVFAQLKTLNAHKMLHKNPNQFKCDMCDKVLSSAEGLKIHRAMHEWKRPSKIMNE